jgi:O-antigen/teichoic acid export membrane protein
MASTLLRGFRAMLFADILRVVAKGLVILLLARYFLTPDEYGLLFLALAILGTARLFSNFGLPKSTARFVTEFVETTPGQIPYLLRFSFRINVLVITLTCLLLVVGSEFVASVLDEPALAPLLVAGVGFIIGKSLQTHTSVLFQAFNDVRWSALVKTVSSVGQVVFATVFLVFGYGVLGALWGFVIASLIAAGLGLSVLYVRFYSDYSPDDRMTEGLRRRVLRYSVPLTATKGANLLDKRVDAILVGYFINPVAVGYYTLAKQISEFVMTPAASLGFTVSPQYGTHKANDDLAQAARLYRSAFLATVTLYIPAAAGLALVADPAVRFIFGQGYLGAVPAVQVFGLYTLLLAVDKITNDGLDYLGRANARAVAKIVTSVANFGLNLVFIPLFGVVGAAVATVLTVAALVGFELYVVSRELPLSRRAFAFGVARATGITAVMSVVVLALLPYVTGLPSLLGVVTAGFLTWALLAVVSGAVDVRELHSTLG